MTRRLSPLLPALLLLLTVFGPISMDLYLPVLPALTEELSAVTSVAQLTVTACLIGLALGQLTAGALSDRFGRRPVLLIGVAGYIVVSLLCALSPTIEILIVARLVQGMAGGAGIVVAQAAGRDLYSGSQLIRFYGRLTVIGGAAAIVGPVLGGQLAHVADWRGFFLLLAGIGALLLLLAAIAFGETLPPAHRTSGGLRQTGRDFAILLHDRVYVGAVLNQGLMYAAVFAYLAGATYVLQGIYGLSPQEYSFAFALNSVGSILFGFLGARSSVRFGLRPTLIAGVLLGAIGGGGLLFAGLVSVPLPVVLASLFALTSGVATTSTPATTIALQEYPQMAGTASSLLGMARYALGGVVAPLVGIAGAATILPLGIVTLGCVLLAGLAYLNLSAGRGTAAAHEPTHEHPQPAGGTAVLPLTDVDDRSAAR